MKTNMHATAYKHITIDEQGVARIDGTRMKVIHIAADLLANNSTPNQMQQSWPHLSLAQIHAALAYYYDHKRELDAAIQNELSQAEALRARNPASPLRDKIRKLGDAR
jgi:uncharacterized protein (DUF433 family)